MTGKDLLQKSSAELGIRLSARQVEQFFIYINELIRWNKKINLSGITDTDSIITKHFVDSLTVCRYLRQDSTLLDIGTGGGFPGIPLAIADSSYCVHMLDSRSKRVYFVRNVIRKLGLENAFVFEGRAEDKSNRIKRCFYDFTVFRAYSDITTILETTLDYIRSGGCVIIMKGAKGITELESARDQIDSSVIEIEDVAEIILPYSGIKRVLIKFKKK